MGSEESALEEMRSAFQVYRQKCQDKLDAAKEEQAARGGSTGKRSIKYIGPGSRPVAVGSLLMDNECPAARKFKEFRDQSKARKMTAREKAERGAPRP